MWTVLISLIALFGSSEACAIVGMNSLNADQKDTETGTKGVLVIANDYAIGGNCGCVKITKWELRAAGPGTIWFQVWRQVSGNTYTLVGQNEVTVAGKNSKTISIDTSAQIMAKSGDYIGFYQASDVMTYYSTNKDYKETTTDTRSWSGSLDWGSAVNADKQYRFHATITSVTDTTPDITNLYHSETILDTVGVGTVVYTLTVTDGSVNELSLTTSSTYFELVAGDVKVKSALVAGPYTLNFTATSYCGLHTSSPKSLNIIVTDTSTTTTTEPTSTSTTEPTTTTTEPTTTSTEATTTTCATISDIQNLDSSATTMDYIKVGTPIYKLNVTGGFTSNVTMDTSTYFEYVPSLVKVKAAMPSGTYVLKFNMTGPCNSVTDKTLTVTVNNTAPFIKNLPASAAVMETETSERLLWTLVTKDTSDFDNVSCDINSTDPATTNFKSKIVTGTSYGIYLKANPTLDYRTTLRYTLTVRCTDTKDYTDKKFYVDIMNNIPPFFNNLPARIELPRSTSPNGTSVLQVFAMDPESDSLTYSLKCSRATTCPFTISETGEVTATSDLSNVTEPAYSLYIYINDGRTLVGPKTLTVIITGFSGNHAPHITNLPMMLYVSENVALGRSLYQVRATDKDAQQTMTFSAVYSNVIGDSLLEFKTSGLLMSSTTTTIDYESLSPSTSSFTITVTASDGFANDTGTITVVIRNVNEAPSFQSSVYSITGDEGPKGTSLGNPGFNVTDPDVGDTHQYSLSCPEFKINASTGDVISRTDYDVDNSRFASTLSCTVTVSDGRLKDNATLNIVVNNINDNAPKFVYRRYFVNTSTTVAVGSVIGSITAKDGDLGLYGNMSYTLNQTSLNQSYLGVTNTGDLYVMSSMADLSQGQVMQMSVSVKDAGGLNDTADILLILPKINTEDTTTKTLTTTLRYRTFFEDTRNCAWFTSASFMAAVTMCVMFYTMYKYSVWQRMKNTFSNCKKHPTQKQSKRSIKNKVSQTEKPEAERKQKNTHPISKPPNIRPPPKQLSKQTFVREAPQNKMGDGAYFKRMSYY